MPSARNDQMGFIGDQPILPYMKARRYSDDLEKDQRPLRQIGFRRKTVLRFAPVGDGIVRAGDHRRVLEERLDDQHQTVPLQIEIGITRQTQGMRDVDPGVDASPRPPCSFVDDAGVDRPWTDR